MASPAASNAWPSSGSAARRSLRSFRMYQRANLRGFVREQRRRREQGLLFEARDGRVGAGRERQGAKRAHRSCNWAMHRFGGLLFAFSLGHAREQACTSKAVKAFGQPGDGALTPTHSFSEITAPMATDGFTSLKIMAPSWAASPRSHGSGKMDSVMPSIRR